eukprot:scaffold139096_cov24-Attheya_sp.AAC.1
MIPNFHDWDLKDGGWRDKIKEELVKISMGHARTIDEILERGSPGDTLARFCLVETALRQISIKMTPWFPLN